jgi:hypothetical protein
MFSPSFRFFGEFYVIDAHILHILISSHVCSCRISHSLPRCRLRLLRRNSEQVFNNGTPERIIDRKTSLKDGGYTSGDDAASCSSDRTVTSSKETVC